MANNFYKFVSKKLNDDSSHNDKMDAFASVAQLFFMGDVIDDLPNISNRKGIQLRPNYMKQTAKGLKADHGIDYFPKNINKTTYVYSHLTNDFNNGLTVEVLHNTVQHFMHDLSNRDVINTVDYQWAVLMDPEIAGTDKHKDSVKVSVFLHYGPLRVIVTENKDKSTTLVLTANDKYSQAA